MTRLKKNRRSKSPSDARTAAWREHVNTLHAIERKLPEHLRTGWDAKKIKTAAKAAQYIKKAKTALRKVKVVEVPVPAVGSYNKQREMPVLLKTQVEHFQKLQAELPERERAGLPPGPIRTEGEAANYIRAMTAKLHKQTAAGKRKG